MEYSSKEPGIQTLRYIICPFLRYNSDSAPFGNPIILPMSGKVNVFVTAGMRFCGSLINDFSVM